MDDLRHAAGELVTAGRGILAADDSLPNWTARFAAHGVPCTEQTRRAYRELLLGAPGLAAYVTGVILHPEALGQHDQAGRPLLSPLLDAGVVPGVKVVAGEVADADLGRHLAAARRCGIGFAKWHAVLRPGEEESADYRRQVGALTVFAVACQQAGLVPMVESEVLMTGDHGLDACARATTASLTLLFDRLANGGADLAALVLKTNLVVPGDRSPDRPAADRIAQTTVDCLAAAVPAAVPGVAFLSGGLAPDRATELLNAVGRRGPHPWAVTFSFGRAIQAPVLAAWHGDPAAVAAAQAELIRRVRANGAASSGVWRTEPTAAAVA